MRDLIQTRTKDYKGLPWILQGPGCLILGPRNHFPGKGNYQEELGESRPSMFCTFLMHLCSKNPRFKIFQTFLFPLFPDSDFFDLGLDAPDLEMSREALCSLCRELFHRK